MSSLKQAAGSLPSDNTSSHSDEASDTAKTDTILAMFQALKAGQERLENKLDSNNTKLEQLGQHVSLELNEVRDRLVKLERPEFDPTRTLIFDGLKPHSDKSDQELLENIYEKIGVKCSIVNVKRMKTYSSRPGLLKCEVNSEEEKIEILRAKFSLNDVAPNVYCRSSKSHTERLLEMNSRLLLKMLTEKQDASQYKVSNNGKIVKIIPDDVNENNRQSRQNAWRNEWPKLPQEGGAMYKSGQQREREMNSNNRYIGDDSRVSRGAPPGRGRGSGRGFNNRWRGANNQQQIHRSEYTATSTPTKRKDRPESLETPPREPPAQPPPLSPTVIVNSETGPGNQAQSKP